MQSFREKIFFAFGLHRNTGRTTPVSLQAHRVVVLPFVRTRGVQRPASFKIGFENRDGLLYIKPLAAQPRTA
jgi:hypothetical protein